MKKSKNIFALLIFLIAIAGIIYSSISLKNNFEIKVKSISILGNNLLSKENYLRFTRLNTKENYKDLTLRIIKDRFEKHPYILKADVRYNGNNNVEVKLYEKNIEAILLDKENQYFITDKLQVLPIMNDTRNIDYPIIANVTFYDSIKVLSSIKKNNDVLTAAKIISAVKFANPELHNLLSAVDLQYGGEIAINFSNVEYPLIIGRGNELRKILYFNTLWNSLKGKELNNFIEYIDLRYGGHIFLGINEINKEAEKKSWRKK